ncbi:glycosyl transferase family 9 [Fibrella aestuarina BUZ 2]|uniref:Glycosyl transferase family 9 n=1 Tax=Fibrella aestuarina BUZ 2 TaxID=1166018 RepID=I0K5X0_9BACT|nr:glycosyltransferase family 9 protein [Fibrella aestuarina]CCG99523.1 glycosyl transferase family 9 [Fibrella aestuarina BUZ 2]
MPGRFLLIQTAFIGDVILATALLERLHDHYPDAQLDMLVRRGNESLLANHPFLNKLLIWEKKTGKYSSLWQLGQQIREAQYDVIINLQRFGATGLLTALSGAKTTIGFDKNPFSRWFTHRIPHQFGSGLHEVDRNAQLLTPLGHFGTERTRPNLYPTPADYAAIRTYQAQPYVCIAPTSVWFTKQFPAQGWIEAIRLMPPDRRVYLLGAPSDGAACEAIRTAVGDDRVINLSGTLSLLQSAALMQGARMNYVNDSAPLHLCSAVNAPTTAVFCSTVPAFGFGPLADQARVVEAHEPLDCRPCNLHGRKACPLGHFRCAYGINIREVVS